MTNEAKFAKRGMLTLLALAFIVVSIWGAASSRAQGGPDIDFDEEGCPEVPGAFEFELGFGGLEVFEGLCVKEGACPPFIEAIGGQEVDRPEGIPGAPGESVVCVIEPVAPDDDDDDDDDDDRDRGGGGGGPAVGFGDQELESGDIETETTLAIEGNNNNQCAGLLQFGNTGNFANQQGTSQYDAGGEFSQEFAGPEIEFGPENETACEQAVQQSAAASSWGT